MANTLDQIANLREEARSLLESVQKEKRNFSKEELAKLDLINQQLRYYKDELDLEDRRRRREEHASADQESINKRFAAQVEDILQVQRRSAVIELRATSDAMATTTNGINNVIPVLQQDLIRPLEKGLVLDLVGHKMLTNVYGEPAWPMIDGIKASYVGEVEKVGASALNITSIRSTPKRMSLAIPISRTAINQANIDLYNIILGELGMGVARKINETVFSTTPNGVVNGPFVNLASEYTKRITTQFTHANLVELEHMVLNNMLDIMSPMSCFVLNSRTAQDLKTTPKVNGQSEMLLQETRGADGRIYAYINGFPALYCNEVPVGTIEFGDYKWLGVVQYGSIDISVDPYTRKREDCYDFVLNTSIDIVKLRKEAFASIVKP